MKKWLLEDVKQEYIKRGYKPLFDKYERNSDKLKAETEEGYLFEIAFASVLADRGIEFFGKANPYTIHNIKVWLKINDKPYTLISDTYINNSLKLSWSCNMHGPFELSWNHIQIYIGCKTCANISKGHKKRIPKHTLVDRINKAQNNNVEITNWYDYTTVHDNVEVRCKIDNHIWYPSAHSLKCGHICPVCDARNASERNRKDIELVKAEIVNNNPLCEIIEIYNYENNSSAITCRCKKHNKIWDTRIQSAIDHNGCWMCIFEKTSGKNNWNYNHHMTDEERILQRKFLGDESIVRWRKQVFERDNYTCVKCGKTHTSLNAHHLNGYHWCEEGRSDINNGATLCSKDGCHQLFHAIYGYKHNTKEQFGEFMQLEFDTEDELCYDEIN